MEQKNGKKVVFVDIKVEQQCRPLLPAGLYCLTGEDFSCGRDNLTVVRLMLAAGVKTIQYREKEKSSREKYAECLQIRAMTRAAGVTFIVNDDIDLAVLTEADGVHIGQDDLPLPVVRRFVGEQMLIGLSTHSLAQAQAACEEGADYLGVGPIFVTTTKKDAAQPVGVLQLAALTAQISLPLVAIGGIKESNFAEVVRTGVHAIAVISDIVGAEDIVGKIRKLENIIIEENAK